MNAIGYVLLAGIAVWLLARFRRDLHGGMASFLGCVVFLPEMLGIALPGSLPQLTAQRIVLLVAWSQLARHGCLERGSERVPYLRWLLAFGLAQVVSVLGGIVFLPGLKSCIDYAIEAVLFFVLVSRYLQRGGEPVRLLSGLVGGLACVAALGALQRFARINFIPYSVPADLVALMDSSDISSTYPHRILFGYAMAMGTPLAVGLAVIAPERGRRWRLEAAALLLIVACYFSNSRGPWLGMILGMLALGVLGGKIIRRKLALVALLAGAVLILRPGVRDTISRLTDSTFQEDSLKGSSYEVRWILWHVAGSEIQRSPWRLLFGYGPVSTESMDFTSYWGGREGGSAGLEKIGHTSWDNNYAADLIELGATGFILQLALLALIARSLLRNWRAAAPGTRPIRAGVAGACLVFMFAMSNVFIFSPQLKYLFWALVAIGSNASWSVGAEAGALPGAAAEEEGDEAMAARQPAFR